MKRLAFFAAFLAVVALSVPVAAEPLELKLARVLSWQKKYDEALQRYRSYLASHPRDAKAHLEMGDICLWTKRYDCAREQYEMAATSPKLASEIEARMASLAEMEGDLAASEKYLRKALAAKPEDAALRLKLARVLSYEKEYEGALAEYDRVTGLEPGNFAALSERADVLSWEGRYAEAVAGYDRALEVRFDAEVARQKARVLGWWKKYGRAIEAYDEAFEKSGKKAIELERMAKQAFWNRWTLSSLKRYEKLLAEEPGNVEGRFDLAQVEGYVGMWAESSSNFGEILKEQPWHFRAEDSLDKVEMLREKRSLVPSVGWFMARSDDRATHINRFTARGLFSQPLADHAELVAGYSFDEFLFASSPSISRHQGRIGAKARLAPRVWGEAYYLPTGYPFMNRLSQLFEGSLGARPFDPVAVTAFVRRDDLTNQRVVFDRKLRETIAGGSVRADLHRRVAMTLDGRYNWINDSNRRYGFGAEEMVFLSYEPRRLTLSARFDFFNFRFSSPDYWSPQNYWSTEANLHWRHYMNPGGMYFGALERYYGVKYRFQIDRGIYPYNGGALEAHYDFTRRLGLHFEARGGASSVYYDAGAEISLTARF